MTCFPVMYVITVDGDKSDPDYTGVTKRITATGAQYQIVGPLAEALKGVEEQRDPAWSAHERLYGVFIGVRNEIPGYFLIDAEDGANIETNEAVRSMAQEIKRLRGMLVKITSGDQYRSAWDAGYDAAMSEKVP
jgi:hypothetical protein